MSHHTNPYAKKPTNVDTEVDNNVSMKENSPSLKDTGFEEEKQEVNGATNAEDQSQGKEHNNEEEIDCEENPFQIPHLQSANYSRNPLH